MSAKILHFALFSAILFCSGSAKAGLLITEVMYSPFADPLSLSPDASPGEWIELFNTGPGVVDLSQYELVDGAGHSFGSMSGSLGSNESIVVYNSLFALIGPSTYDLNLFPTKWGLSSSVKTLPLELWQSMSDPLILPSESRTLTLKEIGLSGATLMTLADFDSAGWPSPPEGYSIFLNDLANPEQPVSWLATSGVADGDIDSEQGDFGSPGFVPHSIGVPSVPEPTSLAIFAGLLSVPFSRRRQGRAIRE